MATFCFDIDGTICTKTKGKYKDAKPIEKMINLINELYDKGHMIIIYSSRSSECEEDVDVFTFKQLEEWGVKFHEYYCDKPSADYYIDDKAVKISDFLLGNY
jgi:histidinol phosphatase-like enzyme